ncbi:MAG TPA: PHP domain-containing protein [Candidatus Saccharimonadales bacterium]|nr:PHP domain-containing protein [Candidatus Saccharimonadales bacterium]
MNTYKVDLHTHSVDSPDGSLTFTQYKRMLDQKGLDCIAITDHNTIGFAKAAQAALGSKIIVGEEVTTTEGELIGLFLTEAVPAGLTPLETAKRIKAQGGLVYVPHPFETVRSGMPLQALDGIAKFVDIVEVRNGRAVFQNRSGLAEEWAAKHKLPGAASSDTHGWHGWGKTYTSLGHIPRKATLAKALGNARYTIGSGGLRAVLYPKFNRLRKGR